MRIAVSSALLLPVLGACSHDAQPSSPPLPVTVQQVADCYAADIETFGFDFDTAARWNYHFASQS